MVTEGQLHMKNTNHGALHRACTANSGDHLHCYRPHVGQKTESIFSSPCSFWFSKHLVTPVFAVPSSHGHPSASDIKDAVHKETWLRPPQQHLGPQLHLLLVSLQAKAGGWQSYTLISTWSLLGSG